MVQGAANDTVEGDAPNMWAAAAQHEIPEQHWCACFC
jgi:hypothetical protein